MIDTHCHIDDPAYTADLEAVLARQREAGVSAILVPATDAASCDSVLSVCRSHPDYLYPALGLHPENVDANYQAALDTIRAIVYDPKVRPELIAIGEIGLDYHFSSEFAAEQQDALRQQLHWALDLDLPVMLHLRDATEDSIRLLHEVNQVAIARSGKPLRAVAHCFSGSYETALAYLREGFYLGIGGVITFRNCRLADTLCNPEHRIPIERLVLETDAPYMTPVPYRGQPNESRYMSYVVDRLAAAYGVPQETIIQATTANAIRLFGRKIEKK